MPHCFNLRAGQLHASLADVFLKLPNSVAEAAASLGRIRSKAIYKRKGGFIAWERLENSSYQWHKMD